MLRWCTDAARVLFRLCGDIAWRSCSTRAIILYYSTVTWMDIGRRMSEWSAQRLIRDWAALAVAYGPSRRHCYPADQFEQRYADPQYRFAELQRPRPQQQCVIQGDSPIMLNPVLSLNNALIYSDFSNNQISSRIMLLMYIINYTINYHFNCLRFFYDIIRRVSS